MIISVLLLLSLGTVIIYTSNPLQAYQQLFFAFVGFIFYFLIRTFNYKELTYFVKPLYIFIIGALILTLVLNIETRGSVRWIQLGPFNFQPSEFAKPILILTLASFWAKKLPSWRNIVISLLLLLPIVVLVLKQPDLGTALTIIFIWFAMLICTNISIIKTSFILALGTTTAPLGWIFLESYQKQRVISFLSPTADPQGSGFHIIQSMIAVGSGEFWGRGLGQGTQSRLQFLPEFKTDFIFAFIGEELGFVGGAIIVLGLYCVIFFLLFRTLNHVSDKLGELIIVGTMSMLLFQILVNAGMNLGILPVTGITFPLLSYGGSSVVTTLLTLGLIASVERYGLKRKEIERFRYT